MIDPGVDVSALRDELAIALRGDIRFDAVSKALYSTDASVYQIEPIGVALPRSRDDLRRIVQICARTGCPITMRGGGTSQAGQAIGAGLIVDTSNTNPPPAPTSAPAAPLRASKPRPRQLSVPHLRA